MTQASRTPRRGSTSYVAAPLRLLHQFISPSLRQASFIICPADRVVLHCLPPPGPRPPTAQGGRIGAGDEADAGDRRAAGPGPRAAEQGPQDPGAVQERGRGQDWSVQGPNRPPHRAPRRAPAPPLPRCPLLFFTASRQAARRGSHPGLPSRYADHQPPSVSAVDVLATTTRTSALRQARRWSCRTMSRRRSCWCW